MESAHRPRRPSYLDPATLEVLGDRTDPVAALHAAHESAAVLIRRGGQDPDPLLVERLIALVDEIGLSTLADLWSARPARSLPGALWRLYLLREWTVHDPDGSAREYSAGIRFTEPNHAVAGVDPPGPQEIRRVTDQILRGAFTGDFADALERAAAFCRVVSSGRADVTAGVRAVTQAQRLQQMADDLAACARLWRADRLE